MDQNETTQLIPPSQTYKSFFKIVLLGLNLCLSSFYIGYCIVYLEVFEPEDIKSIFNFKEREDFKVILRATITFGATIGALFSFLLLNKFSRRKSLLAVNCFSLIIGSHILIPQNIALLIIYRLSQGFCAGIYSVLIPIMIREFAPTQVYGTLGCLFQCFIAVGSFTLYFLNFIFQNKKQDWRIIFGFPLITTSIQTLLLLFLYRFETPIYLLIKNEDSKCKKVLKKLYKQEYIERIYCEKYRQVYPVKEPLLSESWVEEMNNKIKFGWKRFLVAIHIVLLRQFCGTNLFFNSPLHLLDDNVHKNSFIGMGCEFFGSLLAIYFFSKFGRKSMLQAGTLILIPTLLSIFLIHFFKNNEWMKIVSFSIYYLCYGLTIGPFFWIYIPQILPSKIIPVTTGGNWAAATIILTFSTIEDTSNQFQYLVLFCLLWCFFSFFISTKFVLETKGKSQEPIYAQYDNSRIN